MAKKRSQLLLLLAILLLVGGAQGHRTRANGRATQHSQVEGRVIFWSAQGPVAVERSVTVAGPGTGDGDAGEVTPEPPPGASSSRAERLIEHLLAGPTPEEKRTGLWTAIPEGTRLLSVVDQVPGTIIVRLDVPEQALRSIDHASFEIMVDQIGDTLIDLAWRDLRIQVRDPSTGAFSALADFLPPVTVPSKLTGRGWGESGVDGERPEAHAQPPGEGQGQPEGSLSGKTVYVSAGHGWEWVYSYAGGTARWKTQRPPYPGGSYEDPIIEDHNNAEVVNQYLLQYLWNAGALVWPARERDLNPRGLVMDDKSGDGFVQSGWMRTSSGWGGHDHEAETVSGSATATASWTQPLPADGRYAVYVWYRHGAERPPDARYTVHHAGGQTTVEVDQRAHGYTWRYIGSYGFLADDGVRVTLTNQSSSPGKVIAADAVRVGGGTFDGLEGIDTAATAPPHKAWWEVAAFYYTQRMGMNAALGDITARPVYARWEHAGTGDDAVYVSWHTNGATGYQWSYSGTETYVHNGEGLPRTEGSLELRRAIHTEVVKDIRAGWDGSWVDRGEKQRNLGELRLLWDDDRSSRMPGALIEIGFHDHPGDTDALKEPVFNQLVARAVYQGIAKYFDPDAILLPEPPTHLAVENTGGGGVRVSWRPPSTDDQDLAGHGATGYRVYVSANGLGWSNGIRVSGATETVLDGFSPGQRIYVRVTATNAGGESFPTETLAARIGDDARVLLVNGFDRLNRTMVVRENDPVEGRNARMLLDRMNRYDYVVQHAEAIAGHAFDSASNEAVESGCIALNDYAIVDWILGEESYNEETLSQTEQALLKGYLESGRALFISGSELAWDLDHVGTQSDADFYHQYLRARYVSDDAETYQVYGVSDAFAGLSFSFDAPVMYDADFPDALGAVGGSEEALLYPGSSALVAGVQYADGCQRIVTFGFPFETIRPEQRSAVMAAVLGFLDECADPVLETSIDSPVYGSAHRVPPTFNGTAQAQVSVSLEGVEVLIRHEKSGQYWDGTALCEDEVWLTASGTESWSYPLPGSLPDGTYQLQARARAGYACDDSPAEVTFTYDTAPPSTTRLIAPVGGVTVPALEELTLDWADVGPDGGSAIAYRVELDDALWTTTVSSYTVTQLAEGTHSWRVQVEDEAGNASAWTPAETFSVVRHHSWLPLVLRGQDPAPPPCADVIVNGGFESEYAWIVNPEGYTPYSAARAHSGLRSGMVGYDQVDFSSVRQVVDVPVGSRVTLRLWVYPISQENDPDDVQYVSVWDQWGGRHHLELATSDAREWRQGEYDLTDFAGQQITIVVGATNDKDGNLTRAYVDDVELEVCR